MKRIADLLLLVTLGVVLSTGARAYGTKSVFLCVMDGVRFSETFGDPRHENIPHMWNDLRPQATVFTSFFDTGVTVTRQGHSTLATGTWQTCPNGGPRMTMPSIFDYYRDELNVPQSKTWAIFGKGAYSWAEYSSFPVYKDRFKPSFQIGIGETSTEDDRKVQSRLFEVMDRDHPSLVFVNFGYTDHSGHVGSLQRYLDAIKNVDGIFYEIWQKIQSDPVYKDRTTLILVNDHGRHTTDFKSHGDACEGCRHIMLEMLGPDVKKGETIDRRVLQVDIAPTIGELLGFQTPLAQGEVLKDCLLHYEGVNRKMAKTRTEKQAVRLQKLTERDLTNVVAGRLRADLEDKPAPFGTSGLIACSALAAASRKTGNPAYLQAAEDWTGSLPSDAKPGSFSYATFAEGWIGISTPGESETFTGYALSSAEAGRSDLTPAICNLASRYEPLRARATRVLLEYVATRTGYDSELAYHVIQTALNCPSLEAVQKESMFAAAYMLGQIPECGGVAKDAGDSALILCTLSQMQRLPWWRQMGGPNAAKRGAAMQSILQGMTQPELKRLTRELGQPDAKAPRRVFQNAVALKGKQGLRFSLDLLRYSVDPEGHIPSRDNLLSAGAFLLIDTEAVPRRRGGRAVMRR